MEYISAKDASRKWGITERTVQNYCKNMKIAGAKCVGIQWLIPSDAEMPVDGRTKSAKKQPAIEAYHFPLFVHSPYYALKAELKDNEKMLFDAENLYLSCNYAEAIVICRQIQNLQVPKHVLFGSYCVTGYASLVLGLYTEYESSVSAMKQILYNEQIHKEDYLMLLNGLTIHATKDSSLIYEIDPMKLSSEAIYYYQQLIVMTSIVNLKAEEEYSIRFYLSCLRRLELEGIEPSIVNANCMLSILYERNGDEISRKAHMRKACDTAVKGGMYSLLVKFSMVEGSLINECLSKYDEKHKRYLEEIQKKVTKGWSFMFKTSHGTPQIPELTASQNEILFLLCENFSKETITSVKNMSEETLDEELNEIACIIGADSADNLQKYGKKLLSQSANN